jgi:hypothetical protein
MERVVTWAFAMVVVTGLLAPQAEAQKSKQGGEAVLTPAAELRWDDVPGFPA